MNSSARLSAAVGVAAWLGALTGWASHGSGSVFVAMGGVAAVLALRRHRVAPAAMLVAAVAVAASLSGALGASRHDSTLGAQLRDGQVHIVGIAADEPIQTFGTTWVVVKSSELVDAVGELPPVAVSWVAEETPRPGDIVAARGRLVAQPGTVRGDPTAGRVYSKDVRIVRRAGGVFHSAANVMRSRVGAVLDTPASGQADALLAGFLIGDTSNLESSRIDALRKAGLSHFVAVSGSNVALFLAAWWLALTPLAGPRVRAVTGLVGLVLFVVVTRWEPSVLRAATMLGLILAGRLASIPIDPVVALGWGVAALLLVSGDLAVSVGFQLSLAATVGVMVGTRAVATRRPRWVWAILGATGGAQVAVAPLVLLHFETVPLMAPVANLIAAPLVTLATSLGGLAVLVGGGLVLGWARAAASAVLWVADRAGSWPQLDLPAFGVVLASLSMLRIRRLRPVVAVALIVSALVAGVPGTAHPGATLTALDIGQGDAILLRDGESVMLIDGGPHPQELADALARHRVGSIEIVVVTHGDADHAAGLLGVLDRFDVAELWVPAFGVPGAFIEGLVDEAAITGTRVVPVAAGAAARVGRMQVSVLGPSRRFKSDNDGAIVLWVDAGSTSVLLPSDAEAVALGELPPIRPDVMLVPHHGSATTDDDWLEKTTGALSIISVGENRYGHPDPRILDILAATGTRIRSTQEVGDVVVPLLDP